MVTMTILVFFTIIGAVLVWKRGQIPAAVAVVFLIIGIFAAPSIVGRGVRWFVTGVFQLL